MSVWSKGILKVDFKTKVKVSWYSVTFQLAKYCIHGIICFDVEENAATFTALCRLTINKITNDAVSPVGIMAWPTRQKMEFI